MPINKKYPLAQLIAACQRYIAKDGNESARKHVTIEYVMLEGVNDQPEHAQQLLKLLKNLPSKINLIPFNPFPHAPYGRSSRNRIISFQKLCLMQDLCVRFVKHVAMILMPHVDNWSAKLLTVRVVLSSGKRKWLNDKRFYVHKDNIEGRL